MQHLPRRAILGIALLLLSVLAAAAPALAGPVTVNLRIEGSSSTIYEGPVTTNAKPLTKDASGPHACDGTNKGANPTPGPTMTTALDDGSIAGGFTWAGTWFDSFQDFTIDRIGPDSSNSTQFWGYALNYKSSNVGGCQQEVAPGDDVLFAYDYFSKAHLLKLTGPATAESGQPFAVKVVDGQDGSAISGASVGGQLTGVDGTAQVTLSDRGDQRLKAERTDSVRSNALVVCVHQGDDGTCGTASPARFGASATGEVDHLPAARILGIANGQRFTTRTAPRLLRGHSDPGSAGLYATYLRLRRTFLLPPVRRGSASVFTRRTRTRCQFYSVFVERFRPGRCDASYFLYRVSDRSDWSYLLPSRLLPGRYGLDVVARDRRGRRARAHVTFTVVEARR